MAVVVGQGVFCDVPKCGSTSIYRATGQRPARYHVREVIAEHLPRFAVVRNPYDRALSLYHYERGRCARDAHAYPGGSAAFYRRWRLDSLDGFLERCIENRETEEHEDFLPCDLWLKPLQPLERVLRLETLQADWDATPYLPKVVIGHYRKGTHERSFTRRQRELVRAWAYTCAG